MSVRVYVDNINIAPADVTRRLRHAISIRHQRRLRSLRLVLLLSLVHSTWTGLN